jgi:hypothetical protein
MVLDADDRCEHCHPLRAQRAVLAKQRRVMSFLDEHGMPGAQTDRMVDGGECGKERPDRVYELWDRFIVLEVDEHQHDRRLCECEQIRMVNVSHSFGGLPVQWVRFNPDAYRPDLSNRRKRRRRGSGGSSDSDHDDYSLHSALPIIGTQQPRSVRMGVLASVLRHLLRPEAPAPTGFVTALYLYFDGWQDGVGETKWHIVLPWESKTE